MKKLRIALLPCLAAALLFCGIPLAATAELPESYDPRPSGEVSAVFNQNPWGICWDAGGISTLENYLIHAGLADSSIDLSEEHLLWACLLYTSLTGALKAERRDLGIIIDVDKLTKDRRPAWLTELQQALKSMEVCPCR